jgi:hypothetical protein
VLRSVYLNRRNGGLGDEPGALVIVPFSRQWLHELGLAVNQVVPEHTELVKLTCQILLTGLACEVGIAAVAV